jgi:hypothetical protein
MGDKLVFILPESLEDILWVAPSLMNYLEDRLLGNMYLAPRPPAKITLVCKWPELTLFLKSCWKGVEVVTKLGEKEKDEADLLFAFDMELIYKWSKLVEKHISTAAAFYLGTQVLVKFPPVAMVPRVEIPGLVLVVAQRSHMEGAHEWPWFWDWNGFMKLGAQQKITMNALYGKESWEKIREEVSRASVVVGLRGTATLLAAAMGKVVMELSPDLYHREWTSKWESVRYRMIYGKLHEMPADFILDRTGRMVKDLAKAGEIRWVARRSSSLEVKVSGMVEGLERMVK